MYWYFKGLRNYAVFTGRAGRKEYWLYVLFNTLASVVLNVVDEAAGLSSPTSGLGPLSIMYDLAVTIPSLAVCVRRLHDIGKSGWWLVLFFVPCLGMATLVFLVLAGEDGRNKYGEDPRAIPESPTELSVQPE